MSASRKIRRRPPPWTRLAICTAVGLLLGWQIVAAGLSSRMIAKERFAAASLLAPWSARALGRDAAAGLMANPEQAAARARAGLKVAPLDAVAIRTLALASESRGKAADSFALMTAAGALGWRDEITQLWLYDRALQSGEVDVAMQRADALLRLNAMPAEFFVILRDIARKDAANAALARQLSEAPPWRAAFFAGAAKLRPEELPAQERLLVRLASTRTPPSPAELRGFLSRAATVEGYAKAHALWIRFGGNPLLHDGGFENSADVIASRGSGPFEWRTRNVRGLSIGVEQPNPPFSGKALSLRTDDLPPGLVLSQNLLLPAGRYSLSFAARRNSGSLAGLEWHIACAGEIGAGQRINFPATRSREGGWSVMTGSFEIPASNCAVQQIGLRSNDHLERATDLFLDDIAIRPLSRAGRK